jgi:hypothetical protein
LYGDYWQPEWCNAIEGSLSCFVCLMKKPDCASLTYTECLSDLNCVVADLRLCTAICNPADFNAPCCEGKAFCMPRVDCDHLSGCFSDGLKCLGGEACVAQLDLYSQGTTQPTDSCRCLDEDACFENNACEAIPYWGESFAPCEVDERNFSTNCPFMGCRRATGACPSLDTLIDQCKTYCSYNSFPIDADGCHQCPDDNMACGEDAKSSVCQ